jgi:hypothetical protein
MLKKLIINTSLFAIMILISISNIHAMPNGVIPEEIQQSDEEIKLQNDLDKKIEEIERYNDLNKFTSKVDWKKLNVPYVKQKNDYYCGPATTLQTQKYYNSKTSSTQDSLAKTLGTTKNGTAYSKIKDALNSRSYIKKKYAWLNVTKKDKLTIANYIGYSIQIGRTVVLNIAARDEVKGRLGYYSEGHYLNASGVYGNISSLGISAVTRVFYTDPYNEYGTQKKFKGKIDVSSKINKQAIDGQPAATKNILW